MFVLFAVHISDGVLLPAWQIGGFLATGVMIAVGLWNLQEDEPPRIALLSAAFFVASLIHIPLVVAVHPVLNGLIGIILGWRAGVAIAIGLFLQAALLHHGGLGALGVNIVVVALPAFFAGAVFRIYARNGAKRGLFWLGGTLSFIAVELSVTMDYVVLRFGALPEVEGVAAIVWLMHLPVAIAEGIVTGFAVDFLARIRPDWLGIRSESVPPTAPPTAPSLH